MAQRSGRHDDGLDMLVGTLLVVLAGLALTALAGSFGHTRRISQDAPPVWTSSTWK
jgi:hypothetical protein